MKAQKSNSRKVIKSIMMSVIILSFFACGNNKENSNGEQSQTPATKTEVKAPDTDIHTATFLGDLESVQQHIKAGSDLNIQEPTMGSTALLSASLFGKTDIAIALIEAGADLNIQNNEGSTALHSASFLCRTEIVETLLKHNADRTLKNIYGFTALDGVIGSWAEVKPIYDEFAKALGPLGLKLDFEQLEETRPLIAEILP